MMCRETVETMTEASEGALSGWRKLSYGLHITICPYCRAHRRQLETTVDVVKALPRSDAGVTSESRAHAIAAFRERRKSSV